MKDNDKRLVMQRIVSGEQDSIRELNLHDIADDLLGIYEEIQPALDDWGRLTVERVGETLLRMFSAQDIGFLLHMHNGKGIMLGAVIAMCAVEDAIQPSIDEADDDLDEDSLSEIVADGVLGFDKGGSGGTRGN